MESEIEETQSSTSKLGLCNTCRTKDAKYTCPRCGIKSCSLSCVKSHKEREVCTGQRRRTGLVPKEDMDNFTLLSDYRLLEEIDHKLEDNLRLPLRRHVMRGLWDKHKPALPNHLQHLRSEAWKRGVTLKFMPSHFTTHKENSTRFNYKDRIIRWHIRWIFHQADVTFYDSSIDENTPIMKLLVKYLNPENDLSPSENEKLAYYQSASYGKVAVLIKTDLQEGGMAFQELVLNKNLRLNLANKTIYEYPTLYVVLKDHIDAYLDYQPEGHEDLFMEMEVIEAQKNESLNYFNADSTIDQDELEEDEML